MKGEGEGGGGGEREGEGKGEGRTWEYRLAIGVLGEVFSEALQVDVVKLGQVQSPLDGAVLLKERKAICAFIDVRGVERCTRLGGG